MAAAANVSSAVIIAEAARAIAGAQHYPAGALYVVATPIGNLADLTLRAVHVLGLVDALACEDTRVTGHLLNHLGLRKPLVALHAHNEREMTGSVIDRLRQGQRVAYVSDAGTPAISDPGAALVAAVRAAGHRCVPIPGPSSITAAMSVAGDVVGHGFTFAGFAPSKAAQRRTWLDALLTAPGQTTVLLEAPHRIPALLDALAAQAPERPVTIARELTKQFEEIATLAAREAPLWLAGQPQRGRGEFVLVLHAMAPVEGPAAALEHDVERILALLMRELPLKQAVALAAQISGAPRNALYAHALALDRED